MFNFFKKKKSPVVFKPQDFIEDKKKVDAWLVTKLKEVKEYFFFHNVQEIIMEYSVISIQNRNKLTKEFILELEALLTTDEKNLFSKFYTFDQFKLISTRFFIKEIETLNILLKTKETEIPFKFDCSEQDKEIYKFIRSRHQHIDTKQIKKIFGHFDDQLKG